MDGLQGAILRVKLGHLEKWTEARRSRARLYDQLLSGLAMETPVEMSYSRHVYHLYAIRADRRDALYEALQETGIQVGIHYPVPVHLQEAYADLGYGPGDFPEAERVAGRILSLPVYPELSETAVNRIADCIRGFEG
jgi:dTDP-4-amino-4,6-dideoxygalactose transaminase